MAETAGGGGGAAVAAATIPDGVPHLSNDGFLNFSSNDFDAAQLMRLVDEYGGLILEVKLE